MSKRKHRKNRRNNTKNNFVKSIKLVFSIPMTHLLNRVYDMGDPIAKKLIKDSSENSIKTNISWLNLTQKNDMISYAPSHLNGGSKVWEKDKRRADDIKSVIRRIYPNSFSNSLIKKFISRYKKVYADMKNEKNNPQVNKKFKLNNDRTIDNLLMKTENSEIRWELVDSDDSGYEKYITTIKITDNKTINIILYYFERNQRNNFITIYFIDNNKKLTRIRDTIKEPIGIFLIVEEIKNKKQ